MFTIGINKKLNMLHEHIIAYDNLVHSNLVNN